MAHGCCWRSIDGPSLRLGPLAEQHLWATDAVLPDGAWAGRLGVDLEAAWQAQRCPSAGAITQCRELKAPDSGLLGVICSGHGPRTGRGTRTRTVRAGWQA